MARISKIFLFSALLTMGVFLIFPSKLNIAFAETPPFEEIKPKLSIPFPNLNFSTVAEPDKEGNLFVSYLPEYISAGYSYLIGIAGILAVSMIMYGGLKWIFSAGDSGKITAAKDTITHALIGLVLALGSYLLLFSLNPNLVTFKSLKLLSVPQVIYEDGGDTESPLTDDVVANARSIGILCPGGGGEIVLSTIANSFQGKVSYRLGGKGGPPPYDEKPDGSFAQFNATCPQGNLCLDCSGFINLIYKCAGLSSHGGGTSSIFSNSESIDPKTTDYSRNIVNGKILQPGDLIGWKAGEGGKTAGHVVMYIGNGLVAESRGGSNGRKENSNPKITALGSLGYPFAHIKRVSK